MKKGKTTKLSILLVCFLVIILLPTAVSAASGELTGSLTKARYTGVNLTALGDVDWAIWGYSNSGTNTSLLPNERKSSGNAISNLTDIDPGTDDPLRGLGQFRINHTFNWTNGTNITSATGAYTGLQHNINKTYEIGDGFSFTVPADTQKRRLIVYAAFHYCVGELTAVLSDGSAASLTLQQNSTNTSTGANEPSRIIIDYSAASDGQTLTVTLTTTLNNVDGNGNTQIYAVALSDYHTATINIKNGGTPTNSSGAVELRQNGSTVATATLSATGVYSALVLNGDYDIYVDGTDTGENISINAANSSTTMDYYAVNFSVMEYGTASGSTIAATYDGNTISSGDVVLKGKALNIVATASGASAYTYLWTGTGTNSETNNALSITSLSTEVNATCTITGSTYVSVAFDANGGTVSPTSQSKQYGSTYGKASDGITDDTLPTPTKTGYTFDSWWTGAGGTGTQVTNATTVTNLSGHTLYAKWTANIYTIKYNANGGGGTMVSSTHTYDIAETLTSNSLTKTGYDFAGWAIDASGSVVYSDAQSVINLASENGLTVNLYAKWTAKITALSFDNNGGNGGQSSTKTVTYESPMPTPITLPTKTGCIFNGYFDAANGGIQYYDNTGISTRTWDKEDSTATLYAQWTASVYLITYSPNGGSGSITKDSGEHGTMITLDDGREYTKANYVLNGWRIDGTDYLLCALYRITGDVTAEAIWAVDSDGDGIGNADETAAGSNPTDASDEPQTGTVVLTLLDVSGNPMSGYMAILNSTPITTTTDANGKAVFAGVALAPHTLSIRNGSTELGSYRLDFTRAGTNASVILNSGAASSTSGSIATNVSRSFLTLDITLQENASGYWQIGGISLSQRPLEENPKTGYWDN
ncbi:MAG: InlB B-repeat-containing protein [Eubacteriales bacterium]